MEYKFSDKRLTSFLRYVNKVFEFEKFVQRITDKRESPQIKTDSIFMSLFFCILLRWGSFNQLKQELKRNALKKFLPEGEKANCDNSIRYSLAKFDFEKSNCQLVFITKRLKRNKVLDPLPGFQGLRVISLDGTEYFRSSKIQCNDCIEVLVATKGGKRLDYVHRGVFAQMISSAVCPFLAFEPILPKDAKKINELKACEGHEGELTVAKRLLARLDASYPKNFYDVISLDALYPNQPFIKEVRSYGKHLVARVKDERTTIFKEIEALSKLTQLQEWKIDAKTTLKTWDIDDLHISLGFDIPLRGVKAIETTIQKEENGEVKTKTETFYLLTTLVANKFFKVSPKTLVRMIHSKWRIENNGFKDLKDNWFFEHNFFHHPIATKAIVLIFLIVYNLFYVFLLRHLKAYRIYGLTWMEVIRELSYSFYARKYHFSFNSSFSYSFRGG